MRGGMVAVGNLGDIEEARAWDVGLGELGPGVARGGGQESSAIDDREVIRPQIGGQPFGRDEIAVDHPRPR